MPLEPTPYIMPVGIFENDEKPGYYSFSNKTHNMTSAEVFAKYAPE